MNGHILFEFNENEVVFEHYGAPFTNHNLVSLLYQYGGEKEGKSKIGRFGTGFLSTMILTRRVEIYGDLLKSDDDYDSIKGFSVEIDRSGKSSDELKSSIESMEKSKNTELDPIGKTRFVFKLPENNEENKIYYKAYNKGYKSLKKYIAPSLIFNPKIKSITVKKNDECLVYSFEKNDFKEEEEDKKEEEEEEEKTEFINIFENIKKVMITNNDDETKERHFIYQSLTKPFNDKNISVECLLEIGPEDRNIIINKEFLFLYFPMFGEKKFQSPMIINSPDFEPKTERNNIILNSKKYDGEESIGVKAAKDEDKDDDSTAINKFIISESVNLFKQIIKLVIQMGCSDLFNICHGLKRNSYNEFYQKNFIELLRKIILKSPVFEYSTKCYTKCKYVIIPYIDFDEITAKETMEMSTKKKNNNLIYRKFYKLVSRLNYKSRYLMGYSLCLEWQNLLWPDFKHRFDIQQLMDYISKYDDIRRLPFKSKESNKSKEMYIKDLLEFILDMKKQDDSILFGDSKVFLNKNYKLVCKDEIAEFDFNDEVKKIVFNWMEIVNYDYKNKMLSDGLKNIYRKFKFTDFSIEKCIHAIEDKIDKDNSIHFMKYTIKGDEKRNLMFTFAEKLLHISSTKIEVNLTDFLSSNAPSNIKDIINNMFRKADEFIFDRLIEETQKIDVKENIDFLYSFVQLCKQSLPSTKLDNYKIVPNKNFKLCNHRELSKDLLENEKLKNVLKETLKLDLNDDLVHEKFVEFVDNKMNLNDASDKILASINNQGDEFYKLNKCKLFQIIVQYSIDEDYKITLVRVLKFFFKLKNESFETDCKDKFSFELTKKIIELILNDISKCISLFDNIKEFAFYFNGCSDIYQILNTNFSEKKCTDDNIEIICKNISDVYYLLLKNKLLKEEEYKIFPNFSANGDLKYLKDIKVVYDPHIEKDILFTLLKYLIIFSRSEEIKKTILNEKIPISKEFEQLLKDNIINLDWFAENIDKNFPEQNGTNYSPIQDEFVKFINSIPRLREAFANLLERIREYIPRGILDNLHLLNYFTIDESRLKFLRGIYEEQHRETQIQQNQQQRQQQQQQNQRPFALINQQPRNTRTVLSPMNVIQPSSPGYISRPRSSLSNNRLRLSPLNHEQFDLNEKYKKQAIVYEKLINSPKYSNVNWPILSETETSFSLDHNGTKYFINPKRERIEYDISAVSQEKTVYFKVQSYFPLIQNRSQDTVNAFVNDNEEVFYLSNFD